MLPESWVLLSFSVALAVKLVPVTTIPDDAPIPLTAIDDKTNPAFAPVLIDGPVPDDVLVEVLPLLLV
jgi:hypothetical protein